MYPEIFMQVIYETINHWNYFYGINPWRYIGSDQHNKRDYYGSNKELLEDLKIIGKEFFEKRIIAKFDVTLNLSNIELREIESIIQKSLNCAKDETYYNRSNAALKGYVKFELSEEKKKQFAFKMSKIKRYEISEKKKLGIKHEPFKGKKHSDEYKKLIGKINSINQTGSKNSQYGTCWIYKEETLESRKINRNDIDLYIQNGWKNGRKMK